MWLWCGMGSGEWVDPKDVSGEIHKDVLAVVRVLAVSGWRLRRQGHKFYMYCPVDLTERS